MSNSKDIKAILEAATLQSLCEVINASEPSPELDRLLTSLPVFGGEEPESTWGIWSWDADSVLTMDGYKASIEPRR